MELDLTEAIEAGRLAGLSTSCEPRGDNMCMGECYDAAVRAAAPIIERAALERAAQSAEIWNEDVADWLRDRKERS